MSTGRHAVKCTIRTTVDGPLPPWMTAIEEVLARSGERYQIEAVRCAEPAPGDEVVPFSAAEHRTAALPPQPAEVAALLRSIEWHAADEIDAPRCVVCGGQSPSDVGADHTPDCALALMLARCEP